ncbi:hypothetical protein HK102_002145 [Quaeritorhiza haematococci]|nr:hypothetical protein HK102_002145 [Quaeritorhiza haematococci]
MMVERSETPWSARETQEEFARDMSRLLTRIREGTMQSIPDGEGEDRDLQYEGVPPQASVAGTGSERSASSSTSSSTATKGGLKLSRVRLGDILGAVLNMVRVHHVKLEGDYVNVAISVMLVEGIGRQLNPNMDLLKEVVPVIKEGIDAATRAAKEERERMVGKRDAAAAAAAAANASSTTSGTGDSDEGAGYVEHGQGERTENPPGSEQQPKGILSTWSRYFSIFPPRPHQHPTDRAKREKDQETQTKREINALIALDLLLHKLEDIRMKLKMLDVVEDYLDAYAAEFMFA